MNPSADIVPEPDNVRRLPGEGAGTLTTPDGGEVAVRAYRHGAEVVLVDLGHRDNRADTDAGGRVASAELQYSSARGVVTLHGDAVFEKPALIRFAPHGEPEVSQRRSFVRVHVPRVVTIDPGQPTENRFRTVDLSGGGMLVCEAQTLEPEQTVAFRIALDDGCLPISGVARVVRTSEPDQRALMFESIDEQDRQRLIRFVFECMRVARARTRGDWL